ncbi:MAG: CidA/LrgA family protein [Solirubrobacterales bacterium]|nr:CidA/LrgA family protein [Solirubrobacterales bacterium]
MSTAPSRIHALRRPPHATPGATKPTRSAADLLFGMTALLVCQLIGELTVRLTRLPVPGSVIGMLVLLLALSVRGAQPHIAVASDRLLAHLPLLFVPAGVGATQYLGLLTQEWLPIGVTLVASTVLTIAVTAAVMRGLASSPAHGAE